MKDYVVSLLNKTKMDIPAIALAVTLTGAGLGYHFNSYLNQKYQTLFSEVSQRHKDAEAANRDVSTVTDLACATIDIPNTIFEAYNEAALSPTGRFSEKLRLKYDDPTFSHNLKSMTQMYAQQTEQVQALVQANARFVNATTQSAQQLQNSVNHQESNIYLPFPETYRRKVGKRYVTGVRIVMKHVATKHAFTLDKNLAQRGIDSYKQRGEYATLDYAISPTSKINAENVKAIQQSSDDTLTSAQANDLAKNWVLNYTLTNDMRALNQHAANVNTFGPSLEQAVANGPADYRKTVFTPFAALATKGMLESMAVGSIEGDANAPREHTVITADAAILYVPKQLHDKILVSLTTSQKHVNEIKAGLEKLASPSYNYSNKEENEAVAEKILDEARELYEENCPTLAKFPTPKWFLPVIGAVAGGILGLFAGFKVDAWAENQGVKDKLSWKRRQY